MNYRWCEAIGDLDLEPPPRRFLNKAFASEDFCFLRVERDEVRDFGLLLERLLLRDLERLLLRDLERLLLRDLERLLLRDFACSF